ncbi:hypothetical protein AK812_SmicGene4938 [Symbiodinium microadriaticum]|uniref:Uncharacterized protein n=1 Tax=Symbiodinium microadriaticum TaxID=2951 RepID=A0A1Q9EV20_SYMMI|nr:hypothetical protein AK812_SmicGene4938 [Symbiodinium microadriaticum]
MGAASRKPTETPAIVTLEATSAYTAIALRGTDGQGPSWLDTSRVYGHHAAPPGLSYLMGRGKQWSQQETWSPRSWQLWRGSRSAPSGGQKGRDQRPANAFPAYDANRGNAGHNGGKGQKKGDWNPYREAETEEGDGLTQILQTSLNTTRKAEQRVSSLSNALEKRTEMWSIYEKDMANAYRKEHTRFLRDMAKIREDLQKATALQAGARADLMRIFYTGGEPQQVEEDFNAEALLQSWRSRPDEQDARAILQRAAQAVDTGRLDASRPTAEHAAVRAPPVAHFGGPPPGFTMPPGMEASGSALGEAPGDLSERLAASTDVPMEYAPPAARDPYMASPGNHPGHSLPSPGQHYKGADGTTQSVKRRPPAPVPNLGGVPLGTKLDARRVALAPFGLSTAMPPGAPGPDHMSSGADTDTGGHLSTSAAATNEGGMESHPPFMDAAEIQARMGSFANPVDLVVTEEPDV